MKTMKASRRNIYGMTLILIMLVLLVTGACTGAHTSTSTPAATTNSTTMSTLTTTTIPTTSTSTSPTNSTTMPTLTTTTIPTTSTSTTPVIGDGEATEFDGHALTPISQQTNRALKGTQHIDEATYTLTIDGLVDHPLSLSYADLQAYPQISQLMDLNCVEGWNFTAKWTGPALSAIFADAGVQSAAKIAIFYTADVPTGYTSLDLSYIDDNNIIIALKDNDITLTADRGFPFQVVAMGKYGYKWAKWVTRIELSSDTGFRGFWESYGYNNNADVNGPRF